MQRPFSMNPFSKIFVFSATCLICLAGANPAQAHDHFGLGLSIVVNSPPPPPPRVVERPWVQPSPGAVWIEPHYEWSHGSWVWLGGYYMYPPNPGSVWVPGHYVYFHHSHTWVSGYWDTPEPVVVYNTPPPPPAPAPVVVQSPQPAVQAEVPYGNRLGSTTQIQSPYSSFVINSSAPRDTVVYDANTGQPFRIP